VPSGGGGRLSLSSIIDRILLFSDQWLLVMSTQLIGFSIGGICKRFLVAPPSMIWPVNLVTAALFNTLHAQETAGTHSRGGISRERFFFYVFAGYFFYSQHFPPHPSSHLALTRSS